MMIINSSVDQFQFNCGILEIGHISWEWDDSDYNPRTGEYEAFDKDAASKKPTDKDWLESLEADSIHTAPIVAFSFTKGQMIDSKREVNTASLLKFLKDRGEKVTLTPWRVNPNGGNKIRLATWIPSARFKKAAAKATKE